MIRIQKDKLNENVQVNFKASKDILYWANKLNIEQQDFQKKFEEFDFSISKTIAYYQGEV